MDSKEVTGENTTKLINTVSRNTIGLGSNAPLKQKKRMKRSTVILLVLITVLLGFGAIVLLDKVVMPWYVKLGAVAKVPNVNGIKYEEAERKLQVMGFEVKKSEPRFDAQAPSGTVIMQLPYAGSITKQGRRIYLTVSKGENLEFVPNLVGLPLRQARINLIRVGMDVGEIIYEFCDTIGRDLVSGQSIQSTAMARPATKIDVKISRGQAAVQTMMPSLMGLTIQDAKVKLGNAGLSMGSINYKESEAYEENTIIAQSVSAFVAVPQYSRVNVTVCVKPGMLPKQDEQPEAEQEEKKTEPKPNELQKKIDNGIPQDKKNETPTSPVNKPLSSSSSSEKSKLATTAAAIATNKAKTTTKSSSGERVVKDIKTTTTNSAKKLTDKKLTEKKAQTTNTGTQVKAGSTTSGIAKSTTTKPTTTKPVGTKSTTTKSTTQANKPKLEDKSKKTTVKKDVEKLPTIKREDNN